MELVIQNQMMQVCFSFRS